MDPASAERTDISAILLHVEEYGDEAPHSISFYKGRSRTVVVGRKSSAGAMASHADPTDPAEPHDASHPQRALFRCPVVSRKHAKITFTEYGNVYITDLHSHHGTHILRPGELVSTSLRPEVPTVLADGDLITFGKSVGRDAYLVRPVVVRVQLVFGGDAPARVPSPPSELLDTGRYTPSPPEDLAHLDDLASLASARQGSGSGRYGVFLPSPESSPSRSSSDGDSDSIQEITPSSSPQALPSIFFKPFPGVSSERARLLQRFLPPVHHGPFTFDFDLNVIPPASFPEDPIDVDAMMELPELPHMHEEEHEHEQEQESEHAHEEEDMDLSSSRASSPVEPREPSAVPDEPPIVGAYPSSPAPSFEPQAASFVPAQSMPMREIIVISDDDAGSGTSGSPHVSVSPEAEQQARGEFAEGGISEEAYAQAMEVMYGVEESAPESAPPAQDTSDHVEVTELSAVCAHAHAQCASIGATLAAENNTMKEQLAETSRELSTMRETHEASELTFNADMMAAWARIDALDERVDSTHTDLSTHNSTLQQARERLQTLSATVSDLQGRAALADGIEALTKEIGAAKETLEETCALQRQTRESVLMELEAVKVLREEAAAAIAEAKRASAALAEAQAEMTSMSLKRKRGEEAEEGTAPSSAVCAREHYAPLPKRRRTMQAISTVAHTTTVAALGAVAAWTALAFY